MRPVPYPMVATIGAVLSLPLFVFGLLTLLVTGVMHHSDNALLIGSAMLFLSVVFAITGLVLNGVHRMLSAVFAQQ